MRCLNVLLALALAVPQLIAAPVLPKFLDESVPAGLEENVESRRTVGRGVELAREYRWEEPLYTNWIEVDLEDEGLRFRALKAEDRVEGNERISDMAARAGMDDWYPLAAVNGDFWESGGRPTGLTVIDGELIRLGVRNGRPAVVQTVDGEWFIDRFTLSMSVESNGVSVDVDNVNVPANGRGGGQDVILYTDAWGEWPLARAEEGTEAMVLGLIDASDRLGVNRAVRAQVSMIDEARIQEAWPSTTLLLVGYGEEARERVEALSGASGVTVRITCDAIQGEVAWALGGGPILLRDGEVVITPEGAPGFSASFTMTQHPRSLIALSDDHTRLIAGVVDGRQPNLSRGIDLVDMANWLKEQGMGDAMNFDGGGSSSLWVRGETVSSPSDAAGERSVTDGLFLLSNVATGQLAHLVVWPDGVAIPDSLSSVTQTLGFDEGWNPVEVNRADVRLIQTGDRVTAVHAPTRLAAQATQRKETISHWTMHPSPLEMVNDQTVVIHPRAFAINGERIRIPRDAVRLRVDPAALATVDRDAKDDLTLTARSGGTGALLIERSGQQWGGGPRLLSEPLARFPIVVGRFANLVVEGFEESEELPSLDLTQYDADATSLAWETETVHTGARALALTYAMEHGGTSAATLNVNTPLPGNARRVGFQVYGDGGEGWLRGVVTDADGDRFLLDFTNGTQGVNWRGEWRWVAADVTEMRAHWDSPEAHQDPPYTLSNIYLAQTREEKKTSGRLVFDDFGVDVFEAEDADQP